MPITVAPSSGSLLGALAALDVGDHAFGDHDGVIHQHAHGDDQRPQRDTLHLDV